MKKTKKSKTERGRTVTQDAALPASDEGRVEGLHEGLVPGRDRDPDTGQPGRKDRGREPKPSDQRDRFISSEAPKEADPRRTS